MRILAINVGSSTLKAALYDAVTGEVRFDLLVDKLNHQPNWRMKGDAEINSLVPPSLVGKGFLAAIDALHGWLLRHGLKDEIDAVVHRVVHGGEGYRRAAHVNQPLLDDLWQLAALAPLHQPVNLQSCERMMQHMPLVPHLACFDTGFHATIEERHYVMPLPESLRNKGMRHYGFHGLSYAYIAGQLAKHHSELAKGKLVVAHLGSGASLCAMVNGRSVATTMGMTALDGLIMGTRCGSIDPGLVLHLLTHEGMEAAEVERLLYHQSGLYGLSGGQLGGEADMRQLLARTDDAAQLAVQCFVDSIVQHIGSLAMVMEGLDGVVFTAGIGEKAAPIRAMVASQLGWLGARLDDAANQAHATTISTDDSRIALMVIPTDEAWQMVVEAGCEL